MSLTLPREAKAIVPKTKTRSVLLFVVAHQQLLWLDADQQTTLFQREMTMGQSLASALKEGV